MLEINLLDHEVVEVMPDAHICWLKGIDQIERERLKNETAVNDVARLHIVTVCEIQIGPDRAELDRRAGRFFVAPNVELHLVSFEFALEHYRPAAVARVNLRADLNGEMRIDRRMSVEREIDPRNDPSRDRHSFAA